MDILHLEDQLDEKTKLLISRMEKEIESKDKEISKSEVKEMALICSIKG